MDEALKAKALEEQSVTINQMPQRSLALTGPLFPGSTIKETPVPTQTTTTVTQSKFQLPDLTPAQITADVVFLVGIATAFGLKIDGDTSTTLTAAAIAAFAFINAAHKLADAFIRGKRADNADKL